MKVFVKAKPGAKEAKIEKIDQSHLIVAVKEPPRNGLANLAIRQALAEYFDIPPSQIQLISGFKSRQKVFEIKR